MRLQHTDARQLNQCCCFAAVQKSKLNDGIPGELFGIANLFRMTCQNIKTVELLAREDPQASYRIKEVDSAELGEKSLFTSKLSPSFYSFVCQHF